MYKQCPIDNSNMVLAENDSKRIYTKVYRCNICGFEHWRYNTSQQINSEAKRYLRSLSPEKVRLIIQSLEKTISNLPDDEQLRMRAEEVRLSLKQEVQNKRNLLNKGLNNLENLLQLFF